MQIIAEGIADETDRGVALALQQATRTRARVQAVIRLAEELKGKEGLTAKVSTISDGLVGGSRRNTRENSRSSDPSRREHVKSVAAALALSRVGSRGSRPSGEAALRRQGSGRSCREHAMDSAHTSTESAGSSAWQRAKESFTHLPQGAQGALSAKLPAPGSPPGRKKSAPALIPEVQDRAGGIKEPLLGPADRGRPDS